MKTAILILLAGIVRCLYAGDSVLVIKDRVKSIHYEYERGESYYDIPGQKNEELTIKLSKEIIAEKKSTELFLKDGKIVLVDTLVPLCGCLGTTESWSVKLGFAKSKSLELQFNMCGRGFGTAFATIRGKDYKLIIDGDSQREVARIFQELVSRLERISNRVGCDSK